MPACPRCKSIECESTQFDNVPFDQVASGALAARQTGRPAHAIMAIAVWGCIELLNRLRHSFRCLYCGHCF